LWEWNLVLPTGPKLNYKIILGLIVGILGVTFIFGSDWDDLFKIEYLLGVLSIFGAVVAWSFGSVYSKYKKVGVHPLMSASVQMLIAGTLADSSWLDSWRTKFNLIYSEEGLLSLAYLIVFGSIFGYGSYIYAIEHLPLSLVSTYAYVNPVIAVFLGWFFLNEKLDLLIVIGAVVIIGGVILVKQGTQKRVAITPGNKL
jgi:drug/metabolite transporter (DMT)-like permease